MYLQQLDFWFIVSFEDVTFNFSEIVGDIDNIIVFLDISQNKQLID